MKMLSKSCTAILDASDTGCNFGIGTGKVYRDRLGVVELSSVTPPESGLDLATAGPTPAPDTSHKTFAKVFKLKKLNQGGFTTQQAGDLLSLEILRDGSADTCNDVSWVIGGRLTYQTS